MIAPVLGPAEEGEEMTVRRDECRSMPLEVERGPGGPEPNLLILETSGRVGQVAVARGAVLLGVQRLDETRRHARDLAPTVAKLLAAAHWQPRDVDAVLVSRGPGSYTGLRVGIMSAKAFAYATRCALIAVDTFAAIAHQASAEALVLAVIADAQQQKIYAQEFVRPAPGLPLVPAAPLAIHKLADWSRELDASVWITGPGLQPYQQALPPGNRLADAGDWDPRPESLLHLGLGRYRQGERDDLWAVEPLYLRPSSAEEKRQGCSPP